jgi:hypothetical protein
MTRPGCALLEGREVVALTEATATIRNPSTGTITTYRRHNKPSYGPVGDSLDDLEWPHSNFIRSPTFSPWSKGGNSLSSLRACTAAGVEPTFTAYTGDDPVAYVVSLNLRRRHLNESQRAMVAAKLATLKLGDNQHSEGRSIEGASRLLNVGHASVERAKTVQRAGAAELVHAVEQGTVSVSAAADVAMLRQQDQREIVARGEREILRVAQENPSA